MDFARLYGPELNLLLNDSDSNVLYKTALRQQAVNDGMREFAALTECYQFRATVPVSCGVTEYILSTLDSFVRIAPPMLVEYWHTSSGGSSVSRFTVRAGYEFPQVDELWLNRHATGWRQSTATIAAPSTASPAVTPVRFPRAYYVRTARSALVGLSDPPSVGSSESVQLALGYVARPTEMTASTDVPFTEVTGNVRHDLAEYHQAFAHYAAYKLLPLAGRLPEAAQNRQLFQSYVDRYTADNRPRGGQTVSMNRNYLRNARATGISYDASIANDPVWRWK